MKISKKQALVAIAVIFSAFVLFAACGPRDNKAKNPFFQHNANELIQTLNEKIKDGSLKDTLPPEIEKALSERIKTAKIDDFLPPSSVIIFGIMIPIVSILAFFAFLIVLIRLYHIRVMATIEKGNFERKPMNIRWELIFLFIGLILTFVGPAISIYTVSVFGFVSWSVTAGLIPLVIGIAFLVFYKLYSNMKNK